MPSPYTHASSSHLTHMHPWPFPHSHTHTHTHLHTCIPAHLHPSGSAMEDARHVGWEFSETVAHSWTTMVEAIQKHVGSLNWGYRVALRDKGVKYINGLGEFTDPHTIKVCYNLSYECQTTYLCIKTAYVFCVRVYLVASCSIFTYRCFPANGWSAQNLLTFQSQETLYKYPMYMTVA